MKPLLTATLYFFLTLGIHERVNAQNLSTQHTLLIEKQIDSIFRIMVKAAEKLDYDKLSTGVNDRHHAGFIVNNLFYTDYDSLVQILKSNAPIGARQGITIQKKKVTVLSGTIVLLAASGNAVVQLNSEQSFTIKFLWSIVYERLNEEWKVIQSHQSQAN